MKLHPEALEVVSFPTDDTSAVVAPGTLGPIDTGYPTPQTYCFVCD